MFSDSDDYENFGKAYAFSSENREVLEEVRKQFAVCPRSERSRVSFWRSLHMSDNVDNELSNSTTSSHENTSLTAADDEYLSMMPTQFTPDIQVAAESRSQSSSQASECDNNNNMEVDEAESKPSAIDVLHQIFQEITSNNNPISAELILKLVKISADDLSRNVTELKSESVDDCVLIRLCNGVTNFSEQLSLKWCISFVEMFILQRVISQNCIPPRNFVVGLSEFARKYSRAVIEGMMVPCLAHLSCGRIQIGILRQLFGESLSQEHQALFLRKFLEKSFSWNESVAVFVSGCVEAKSELVVEEILDLLVLRLGDCSLDLNSNLMFAKFLSGVVTKFSGRLKDSHVSSLMAVAIRNETVLKKGCLNKLKSLT